jgi:predicted enzyme involved in methoxymalonyl-ACP biosynthesis
MICVVIFDRSGEEWVCDTWLMSCRVLKRRVEELVLREVAAAARAEGATALIGEYWPTEKNMIVADHFAKLGFTAVGNASGGVTRWRLELAGYGPPDLPIRIERA